MNDWKSLKTGDWILMKFGFDETLFYVLKNIPGSEIICLGNTKWLVSAFMFKNYRELERDFTLIDHTKERWWWKIFAITDLVHPFKKPSTIQLVREEIK